VSGQQRRIQRLGHELPFEGPVDRECNLGDHNGTQADHPRHLVKAITGLSLADDISLFILGFNQQLDFRIQVEELPHRSGGHLDRRTPRRDAPTLVAEGDFGQLPILAFAGFQPQQQVGHDCLLERGAAVQIRLASPVSHQRAGSGDLSKVAVNTKLVGGKHPVVVVGRAVAQ
jgi:hypothetical protein